MALLSSIAWLLIISKAEDGLGLGFRKMLVDFYHLVASPIERVLPRICERLLEEKERLLIVATPDLTNQLDSLLWSYQRDSFLPHALADADNASQQPILLGDKVEAVNGARNIALADGAWRDEALRFERVFLFFDVGHLDEARTSWRALNGKLGIECRYWKQDAKGKWVKGP